MKVKKAIELLSKVNPEATIKLHCHDGNDNKLLFIVMFENDNSVIWLEDRTDVDFDYHLGTELDQCPEEFAAKNNFYIALMNNSVTVDEVRRVRPDMADEMESILKSEEPNENGQHVQR